MDETGTERAASAPEASALKASALKGRLKDAVDTFAGESAGPVKAEGTAGSAHGPASNAARDQAGGFGGWLQGLVRERPLAALLAAAGIGYSLASIGRHGRH